MLHPLKRARLLAGLTLREVADALRRAGIRPASESRLSLIESKQQPITRDEYRAIRNAIRKPSR